MPEGGGRDGDLPKVMSLGKQKQAPPPGPQTPRSAPGHSSLFLLTVFNRARAPPPPHWEWGLSLQSTATIISLFTGDRSFVSWIASHKWLARVGLENSAVFLNNIVQLNAVTPRRGKACTSSSLKRSGTADEFCLRVVAVTDGNTGGRRPNLPSNLSAEAQSHFPDPVFVFYFLNLDGRN